MLYYIHKIPNTRGVSMYKPKRKIITAFIGLIISILFVYPQPYTLSETIQQETLIKEECTNPNFCKDHNTKEKKTEYHILSFWNWLNNKAYAVNINQDKDNKEVIRQKWEDFFGVDIFYPYFKAKKAEDWLEDKGTFTIFKNIKGEPKIEGKNIQYIVHSDF